MSTWKPSAKIDRVSPDMKETQVQNMQTRLAQMAASGTAAAWKQHRRECSACSSKVRPNCVKGDGLRQVAKTAADDLATARKLDKAVPLGQGTLFGQGTLI